MLQSKLFGKTIKNFPKDEMSLNAQLLIKGGFVDKLMAGVYTLLPLGFRVFKKIEQIIREEMNAVGGQEIFMPALHPKEVWQQTNRWEGFDALVKFKIDEKREVALGPTHEEIISPLAKKFISSYRDLPFAAYHFQDKFRHEKRAKSGILRLREFIMKDLYSFHATQEDLDEYYEKVLKAYEKIFERCGIGALTYLTFASGGAFSKYSHEFQTLTSAGEDLVYICDSCRVAVNKEILADQESKCPKCGSQNLREEKAVEVGNIFKLGTRFSLPFELNYTNKNGEQKPVIMGCYGIGLQRLIGTIVEISHDEKGIIWPDSVAPFKIHLLSLAKTEDDKVYQAAEKLYFKLSENFEVLWDDRLEAGAGEKLADADLIGCPVRLVISEKTLKENKIEFKKRSEKEAQLVSEDEMVWMFG